MARVGAVGGWWSVPVCVVSLLGVVQRSVNMECGLTKEKLERKWKLDLVKSETGDTDPEFRIRKRVVRLSLPVPWYSNLQSAISKLPVRSFTAKLFLGDQAWFCRR